jgi:hypothetical protein
MRLAALTRYWKALISAIPLLIAVGQEVAEQMEAFGADGTVTRADWFKIGLAALTSLLVYAKANTPPEGQRSDPNMSEVG